jgi:hypothetical protein
LNAGTLHRGIIRGRPRDTEILAAQAKKIEAALAREDVLLMAEASLVKAQDLEALARKSLVADSARLRGITESCVWRDKKKGTSFQ